MKCERAGHTPPVPSRVNRPQAPLFSGPESAQVAGMTARHFFCCLPLRLGVFLISLCQLILVGLLAAAGWYTLDSMRT